MDRVVHMIDSIKLKYRLFILSDTMVSSFRPA